MAGAKRFTTRELTTSTWRDFEELFARFNGVWGGCWCMYCHLRGEFHTGPQNRRLKRALVRKRRAHGILVYADGTAVGWCQFGPRDELPRLDGRFYKKLGLQEEERIWRVTCFFVDRQFRREGVARLALRAALRAIDKRGGGIVEAFPFIGEKAWYPGTPRMFEREGFKVHARLGDSRLLLRRTI